MNNKLFYELTLNEKELIKLLITLDKDIFEAKKFNLNEEIKELTNLRTRIEAQKRAAELEIKKED